MISGDENANEEVNLLDFENRYSLQNTTTIFPNPNNGEFTLIMLSEKNETKKSVYMYNVLGELLYIRNDIKNHVLYFDISGLSKGIYFVKVIRGGDLFVGKIIYQ